MNPYKRLSKKSFWKPSVSEVNCLDIKGLWTPKFTINKKDEVITFGSCFAQHMSKALVKNGFNWLNCEKGMAGAKPDILSKYNYGIFSARTGNIYTTKQLFQWVDWSLNDSEEIDDFFWEKSGRFYDPFRPNIEPDGFDSKSELFESRKVLLSSLKSCFKKSDVLVFTLGLTEGWEEIKSGFNFAQCPGVTAGLYSEDSHKFKNYSFDETYTYLIKALKKLREVNPNLKVLLTVSPVPLIATASNEHVLVANSYSKSVLRSVAGRVHEEYEWIDYFPSYEIVTQHPYRGFFYNPDLRTISEQGVDYIMRVFIGSIQSSNDITSKIGENINVDSIVSGNDVQCEEELLNAFAPEEIKNEK